MVSFEIFVKAMPPSLSELKVLPSFCFTFKIPDDVAVTNFYILYSIILDLHFPAICYKKLLTPPVVPANEDAPVGIVTSPSLDDLAAIMPDVAHSLREVLDYRGKFARFQ